MSSTIPTLHLLCGKIASGKSSLAARLHRSAGTVLVAEDEWLDGLYPEDLLSVSDYMRCMSRFRKVMGPHVVSLLNAGVSVVLDCQANTIASRDWMRGILQKTKAANRLHVLDVPDEVCIARLHARNAQGHHPFAATEEQFWQVSRHFVAPTAEEGFDIVMHGFDSKP